ncbi:hypothetical protein [Marivita sp. GX14005]|uniref:hypothetical protein n=1 Tax=Marivita sp. GX14005 TaxID=2942276 RepID=UPI002019295B|nr:hypothetical protein [Marivita sp. GX14005]MCL3883414.1 hypothetical protein [Marivita sp. GX14005]
MKAALRNPLLALTALGIAGCATPREQCISQANEQYRTAEAALATAQTNIARGYALHSQSVPYTVQNTCYRDDPNSDVMIPYSCPSTQYRTETTPVPIDAANERQKVAEYRKILPQLRRQAAAGVQSCIAQYPE